jgi:glycosyltransferase involved in cell wall biosynthesis
MNVLFLSRWLPYPANNGARLRIYNLLTRLLRQGHQVHLLTFYEKGDNLELARQHASEFCTSLETVFYKPFQTKNRQSWLGFLSPQPRSVVTTYLPDMARLVEVCLSFYKIEVVVASEIDMAPYGRVAAKYKIPALLEELELGKIYEQYSYAVNLRSKLRNGLTWWKLAGYVRKLSRHYQTVTVVSEKEHKLVGRLANWGEIAILPNGADLQFYQFHPYQPERRANQLIFNGSLSFDLNYEAARFFLNEIFPLVRQQEPGLELLITGKCDNLDPLKLVLGQPGRLEGVKFTGYVEDIRPLITASRACIVPLLRGGGTRLKILEAFALGTPVVATSKGAEGLDAENNHQLLISDDPADFAHSVLRLLNEPALAAQLAFNARLLTEARYNWDWIGQKLGILLEELHRPLAGS